MTETGINGRRRDVIVGAALCVVPTVAALLLLVAGVTTTDLTLVYASIAASALALPAFVYGVVRIVRAVATGRRPG